MMVDNSSFFLNHEIIIGFHQISEEKNGQKNYASQFLNNSGSAFAHFKSVNLKNPALS